MAAQAVLIAETIAGMKKAVNRRGDASDSDESVLQSTNRGNKLKRKAEFIREGQLDLPNGPRVYKRKIDHAGYKRYIISRNPKRVDEDGDELEEYDIDEQADAAAAEEDPYADIRIEHTLAPLTSAAELPNHPSLSVPYYSKTLTEMAQYAGDVTQKERASLWRTKQLLTKFRGDHTFAPCGMLESETDGAIFESYLEAFRGNDPKLHPEATQDAASDDVQDEAVETTDTQPIQIDERASPAPPPKDMVADGQEETRVKENGESQQDIVMADVADETEKAVTHSGDDQHEPTKASRNEPAQENGDNPGIDQTNKTTAIEAGNSTMSRTAADANGLPSPNGHTKHSPHSDDSGAKSEKDASPSQTRKGGTPREEDSAENKSAAEEEDDGNAPPPHRMTTRRQAQQAVSSTTGGTTPALQRSLSPSQTGDSSPFIHPLFLVVASAHPDRDFGLPAPEAEETRRLLLSTAQKQEEVCRGNEKLYEGLLRADRMRKQVLKWTKAEAHVGEMSDGEDWYDKEEWGLEEDLKKGNEEDEEVDANQGKKTRGRRA